MPGARWWMGCHSRPKVPEVGDYPTFGFKRRALRGQAARYPCDKCNNRQAGGGRGGAEQPDRSGANTLCVPSPSPPRCSRIQRRWWLVPSFSRHCWPAGLLAGWLVGRLAASENPSLSFGEVKWNKPAQVLVLGPHSATIGRGWWPTRYTEQLKQSANKQNAPEAMTTTTTMTLGGGGGQGRGRRENKRGDLDSTQTLARGIADGTRPNLQFGPWIRTAAPAERSLRSFSPLPSPLPLPLLSLCPALWRGLGDG
ncbi:hypothetical protein Purlil1_2683 [Purpureocillium lilacinum]|uniref:Uncharacterized protein n=1 Tax=Purpureocillium lilacinum TaxID=33203 RepID=A0ABR0C8Q5_PURLI|nr:hypothetical protein Purlil1_2683 [Purpureocillium lilacinum]